MTASGDAWQSPERRASEQAREKRADSARERQLAGRMEVRTKAAEQVGQGESTTGREKQQQYDDHFAATEQRDYFTIELPKSSPSHTTVRPGGGDEEEDRCRKNSRDCSIRNAAEIIGRRLTISLPTPAMRPVPPKIAMFIHLLSEFLSRPALYWKASLRGRN